jgi:hypothetical protein
MRHNRSSAVITLLASLAFTLLMTSSPAHGQTPAQPAAPPAQPAPTFAPFEEDYRFEVSVDGWWTRPSTMMYSDTETITKAATSTSAAVTTTVTGTNIDFIKQLNLGDQLLPTFHVLVRPRKKHKIRLDYYPLRYNQTATLSAPLNFNGQTFASGDAVTSSLHLNEWELAYEYDFVTSARGFLGGVAGGNLYLVSGEMSDATQGGTASVRILMPGLGVTGRYYFTPRFSATGSFMGFVLPGGNTSTTGHVVNVQGYATVSLSKYVGIEGGYRFLNAGHYYNSPVNTGDFQIGGAFIGGVFRY